MLIAAQENLVPGSTFAEKLANLHAYGYDGVELNGRELRSRLPEVTAALAGSPVRASTICGGLPNAFTSPDPRLRQDSITTARDLLHGAADSNRLAPGRGHTQFVEPFRALHEIGFDGFGALECRVPEPRDQALRESARFLREQLAQAERVPVAA